MAFVFQTTAGLKAPERGFTSLTKGKTGLHVACVTAHMVGTAACMYLDVSMACSFSMSEALL